MREWLARLRDWFRRDALEQDLGEELRFHHRHLERDAGVAGDAATNVARRQLGNLTRVHEAARERWSIPWAEHVQQDVRYALRGLRRSPGFTATVVITLGLGIGANAAMFGVIDRLMFRPFPYLRDPSAVHRVYLQTSARGRVLTNSVIPYTRYLDLARASSSFSQIAAVSEHVLAVGSGDASGRRESPVAGVTASFFTFFDAPPALGRYFAESEDRTPRGDLVVVLGYGYWQSEGMGGRNVIDQSLQVGTLVYTIIGVAPPGFVGVAGGEPPVAFIPITTVAANDSRWTMNTYFTSYNWDWMSVIVRRRAGVTAVVASADLTNGYIQSRTAQRLINPAVAPLSVARPRAIAGAVKTAAGPDAGLEAKTLLWVAGVAVIVLVIACANVTNLLFARVLRRRREFAMRLALGVGWRRLLAQCITESLLLAAGGCLCGIVLAQWGGAVLGRALVRDGAPVTVLPDWRTLALASACALGAGVLTAIGPALLAIRGDLAAQLRAGGGARAGNYQRSRTRSALLILQGALSVILLVGAGLFVRSLGNARALHLGYDADPVLIVRPNFRGVTLDSAEAVAFRRHLLETAQAIPGVAHATRVNSLPFGTNTTNLRVPGIDSVQRLGRFNFQVATPDFFHVMGTRILRGRAFTANDRGGEPLVTVVSESMARVLWSGQEAIGQCMRVSFQTDVEREPCTTVIGIAEDAVQGSLTNEQLFMYYLPVDQFQPSGAGTMYLRMAGPNAAASIERVRSRLQREMPGQGYVTVQSLADLVDHQRRSWALGATMFVAFGVLALVVAAVGLYGVIAYNVAQRMHELGVRIALGARSRDVVRLVIRQGFTFGAAGVAIGLALALVAAQWLQPLLFRQSARDPLTYGVVGALIIAVAIVASAVPALRAARADPITALRTD